MILGRRCRGSAAGSGSSASPALLEAMRHPERSPYARTGPEGALGGWDAGFMHDPVAATAELPGLFDFPSDWILEPWLPLASARLATRFGY